MKKKIIFVSILAVCLIAIFCAHLIHNKTDKPVLKWGGDSGSGAPFVFRNPGNPNEIIGFDVDLMNAVANELGMKAEFVQNLWDGLIPGLLAKNYDVVANGFEILHERKSTIEFSIPYYVTYEELVVAKTNNSIHALDDLKGKTVGTLPNTLAARMLKQVPSVKIRYYPEEVNAFDDIISAKRLDAVLIDAPIALYYAAPNQALKLLNTEIGNLQYGIGIRKEDKDLQTRINTALQNLIKSGKLRSIIEKWGLWNSQTAKLFGTSQVKPLTEPSAYSSYLENTSTHKTIKTRLKQYINFIPLLLRGAIATIEISVLSMILAVSLGLVIALMRLYTTKFFSSFAVLYIEIMRGTPLLIQLYLIFYGLPLIGIKFSPFIAAILGLGLNYAASEAENYRAGLLAVPKHQIQGALALGMSKFQALRYVIIPQAVRLVIPPITNDFISLIKDSSIVSVITLVELTTVYNQLATTYFDYLGIGILVAFMYFLIGLPFSYLARMTEKKFRIK
jgi:polar amino acid transport system substrate-binding protein